MKRPKVFVGRESELARIARFFGSEQGGAILVAGDRGSGKTSLVEEAIIRLASGDGRYERYVRYFRKRRIIVRVPLIIPDENIESVAAYYRSMLMRAITRGLEQDLLSRRWSKFDLPNRWFRSIGYLQEVHRVVPFAKYTSLKSSKKRAFKLSGNVVNGGIDELTASELEVNDTVLEMALRHLLTNNKSNHEFIFVIDELDKLNAQQHSIHVEDIAMLLKNLFNETGVHVIFISDEPSLGRITEQIRNNPFCAERTLFKDTILLNQMHPVEFGELVDYHIGPTDAVTRRRHVASLSYMTKMMPSEMERLQIQAGADVDSLVNAQRSVIGSFDYSYASTMQLIVNDVYTKYCGRHGQYYDRVLFKALCEAGNNLLHGLIAYVHWSSWLGLLYPSELFDDEDSERSMKNNNGYERLDEEPDIIGLMTKLNSDDQGSIESALGELFVLVDRLDFLTLKLVDKLLMHVSFVGDGFTVDSLPDDINSCLEPKADEIKLMNKVNQVGHIYLAVVGTAVWTDIWPFPMEISNNHGGRGVSLFEHSYYMDRTLSCFWKKLEEELDAAAGRMTGALSEKLARKMTQVVGVTFNHGSDYSLVAGNSRAGFEGKVKVVVNFGQRINNDFDQYDKVYILQDPQHSTPIQRARNVKRFKMNINWTDYEKVTDEIAQHTAEIISRYGREQ